MCESSLHLATDNLKEHRLYSSIILTKVIIKQENLNFFCIEASFGETLLACQELLASHCKVSDVTRP